MARSTLHWTRCVSCPMLATSGGKQRERERKRGGGGGGRGERETIMA